MIYAVCLTQKQEIGLRLKTTFITKAKLYLTFIVYVKKMQKKCKFLKK